MLLSQKIKRILNWHKGHPNAASFIWTTCVAIILFLPPYIKADMETHQQNQKLENLNTEISQANKTQKSIIDESHLDKIDVTDLQEFKPVGDIRINSKNVLSLGKSNFAYFLSNKALFEHATIKIKFIPLTGAADYYIIVENVFQVIIGDGDRRAVSLKSFTGGGDWEYKLPVNRPVDLPPRYYLSEEFPIGNAVIADIDVNAKEIDGNKRSVKLNIKFTDESGKVYSTLGTDDITWEFVVENSPNDKARYGVGLIDPSARHRPRVQFEYLLIQEKQQ